VIAPGFSAIQASIANGVCDVPYLTKTIALMAIFVATSALADDMQMPDGCRDRAPERRVAPCSAVIDAPDAAPALRAEAFFLRGLAHWELAQPERAIRDYDEAIRLAPHYGAALNNRADAYLKLGKPSQGVPDIERALEIAPQDPIYNVTHGQIGQTLGDREGAMRDHEAAMAFGGKVFVKYYQCGLRLARLYNGPIDGILRSDLRQALRLCVEQGGNCDPMPDSVTLECPDPVA
jgi:tetratricopeptide (TPR) repeat protein